jgi:OCT family organic cation transporter-like MFS transporter 4/5
MPDDFIPGDEGSTINEQAKKFIVSAYFIGWAVGCQFAGNWGDKLGRRPTFFRMATIQLVGGLLTAAMPEYWSYVLARFVTGIGVGGFGIVSWVLASEFWGGSYRNAIACIGHTPYAVGLALFSMIAWFHHIIGMEYWRWLALLANVPVVIQLIFFRSESMVPESPRWLMTKHQTDKVVMMMEEAAEYSGRPLPDGWVLQGVVMETPKHSDEQEPESTIGLIDMMGMKYMRGWLMIMGFMWFSTSFGYYGLIYNAENLGNRYTSSIFGSFIEIPAYYACVPILRSLGRKKGSTFFLGTIGVACSLCMFVPEGSFVLTVLGMIGKFGAAGAFDAVYIFATELFPTEVRNISMGTSSTCARIGVLTAMPILAIGGALPMMCFGAACIAAALLALSMPETLGQVMWDTVAEVIAHQDGTLQVADHDVSGEMEDMDASTVTLADVRRVLGDDAVAQLAQVARGQSRSTSL